MVTTRFVSALYNRSGILILNMLGKPGGRDREALGFQAKMQVSNKRHAGLHYVIFELGY